MRSNRTIKLLTVSDLHQSKALFRQLFDAVTLHQPDVVGCVGDMLDAIGFSAEKQLPTNECAASLAGLPVKHLLFVRGNHEDSNWTEFVGAWPHERRALNAVYGNAYAVGPLMIVGFPCFTGMEFTWCAHLEAGEIVMKLAPSAPSEELSVEIEGWLPKLMHQLGPGGRTVWLMHEPPLGSPTVTNQKWASAIARFQPRLTISGHEHDPVKWYAKLDATTCINVGQCEDELRYSLFDFHFANAQSGLPSRIEVITYPSLKRLELMNT